MTNFKKIMKKVLPRLLSGLIAGVCALTLFAFNYFVLFVPDSSQKDIKFEIPDDTSKGDAKKPTVKPTVSKAENYNILVMGHDRAASLTDVIMLINYNVKEQKITIMQLPRDTYVTVNDY